MHTPVNKDFVITYIRLHYKKIVCTISIDTADWELLKKYKWSITDCSRHNTQKFYVRRRYSIPGERNKKGHLVRHTVYMHREIMGNPDGKVVDHLDGNGLRNCCDNFEVITQEENAKRERQKYGRCFAHI